MHMSLLRNRDTNRAGMEGAIGAGGGGGKDGGVVAAEKMAEWAAVETFVADMHLPMEG